MLANVICCFLGHCMCTVTWETTLSGQWDRVCSEVGFLFSRKYFCCRTFSVVFKLWSHTFGWVLCPVNFLKRFLAILYWGRQPHSQSVHLSVPSHLTCGLWVSGMYMLRCRMYGFYFYHPKSSLRVPQPCGLKSVLTAFQNVRVLPSWCIVLLLERHCYSKCAHLCALFVYSIQC